jgi:hypothetical protein
MAMLGLKNPGRHKASLAQRLTIDDLHARLAPLDRYGPTGFGSAIAEGIHTFVSAWGNALRGVVCRSDEGGPDCGVV